LLNYQVGESSFWKKQIIPSNLTPKPLSLSLPASSTPTMESEVQADVITSKKIRIDPKNEVLWFNSLNLYRRAYNLTIEFMAKGRKPSSEFRTQICDSPCLIEFAPWQTEKLVTIVRLLTQVVATQVLYMDGLGRSERRRRQY
jgi:hypothetical protein